MSLNMKERYVTQQARAQHSEPSRQKGLEDKIHDLVMKVFTVLAVIVGELFVCSIVVPKVNALVVMVMLSVAAFTVAFTAMAMFTQTPEIRRKATMKVVIGVLMSAALVGISYLF